MAPVIDLTGDSSPENSPIKTNYKNKKRKPQPYKPIILPPLSSLLPPNPSSNTPSPITPALSTAIDIIEPLRFKSLIKSLCETQPLLRTSLEREYLIQGKDIVRYHIEGGEEEDDGEEEGEGKVELWKEIEIGGEEWVGRYQKCENCEEEFDLSLNERGDCVWHPEGRSPDYEGDFWADHDEDCHGRIADLEDEYPEGFIWDCCEAPGDNPGCMSTKHKAKANIVVNVLPKPDSGDEGEEEEEPEEGLEEDEAEDSDEIEILSPPKEKPSVESLEKTDFVVHENDTEVGQKAAEAEEPVDGAEEEGEKPAAGSEQESGELPFSGYITCAKCQEDFAISELNTEEGICRWHTGKKEINWESDTWYDHNEGLGPEEDFVDDPNYAAGFTWTCCKEQGDDPGCREGRHIPPVVEGAKDISAENRIIDTHLLHTSKASRIQHM